MWIANLKIVLSFCICSILAYHESKQDNINKLRERFLPNTKLTTTSTTTSTTERAPLVKINSENNIYYDSLKLRHSRFPNLDRVMTKLDTHHTSSSNSNNNNNNYKHKVRHYQGLLLPKTTTVRTTTTTTDEGLFDDYYDDEETNDYGEWDNEEEEEYAGNDNNNNNDDYAEEITSDDHDDIFSSDDNYNEFQAEEATEPPVKVPVSSFTKYKWENYGTRQRVEESRRQQLHLKPSTEQKGTNLVVEHYQRVQREGQCRKPQRKVIPVQSIHPDPSRTYTPHCTILYRCAEDTGCCTNFATRCGPKTQTTVHLPFYAKVLGTLETKIVTLTFINHTECACVEKSQTTPTASSTENYVNGRSGFVLKSASHPENIRHCKCPEEFIPKYRYNARCNCDCEEDNEGCQRMKKGKEFFGLTDRKCIEENRCGVPVCEYGVYLPLMGRCQHKQEKLDSYRKFTNK